MKTSFFAALAGSAALFFTPLPAAVPSWSLPPFPIKAGERVLDTLAFDEGGHAAPFLIDLDGDGKMDLVIGSIRGRVRVYRNVGSVSSPQFSPDGQWLMAEGQPVLVKNWCCMAVAPQFADNDGDGIPDLTMGSYGGPIYWFKGLGAGQFKLPHQLLSWQGVTVLAHPETMLQRDERGMMQGQVDSYAANIAWAKWDGDDQWDLILGNHLGELFVWRAALIEGAEGYTAPGLPLWKKARLQPETFGNEILIAGKKVLPDGDFHSAPAVADWDGDGRWDLLVASKSGDVYFLRNTGKPGEPVFESRELLLAGGQGLRMSEAGADPVFGIRTQIHVADYNHDGKPDLLVGAFSATVTPRADLKPEERAKMNEIWSALQRYDTEVGNRHHELPEKFEPYVQPENKQRYAAVQALRQQLRPYLKTSVIKIQGDDYTIDTTYHGHVWVFLRK